MTMVRSPMTVVASNAGTTDPSVKITNYDPATGIIKGVNFGSLTGTVYLLNRDTHSYVAQTVSVWGKDTIILSSPIDLSTIEGNTCFFIRTSKGANSNKYMVYGSISVTGWALVYVKDPKTGAISKYHITSSLEMGNIVGSSSYNYFYGRIITLDNVSFNSSQIVGVQFGSSVSGYTIPAYFLAGLINLDQPVVLTSGMTLGSSSSYFMYNCRNFNCPLILQGTNKLRFGNYFMGKCYSFNQPIDLSTITYWSQTYAFWGCMSFNNELKLTTGLNASSRSFGNNFLNDCPAFNQPITIPSNCNQIGNGFMYGAFSFNQPITFPSSITAIGTYFMSNCYAFDQPIDLSSTTISTVGNYFMYMCKAFNSTLKLPTTMTSTGTYFLAGITGTTSTVYTRALYGCCFNQPLDVSKIKTFGNYFMANQLAFNQPLDLSSATIISTYFMQNCTSFSQPITIPSTVTGIGAGFQQNILTTRRINVETTTVPPTTALTQTQTTSANAPTLIDSTCPAFASGVYIYGSQRSGWLNGLPNSTSSPWRNLIDGNA